MDNETAFAIWHHYFMKFENAVEYLWGYFMDHEGKDLEPEEQKLFRLMLDTMGYIPDVGHIDEEYFEDFDTGVEE
jgi:hypothetical protein